MSAGRHPPIVVVGAGASGLMASISAAGHGSPVIVLERTDDGGRKILMSGGGRCNLLPSELAPQRYLTDSSPNTLRKILTSWPLAGQRRFFEETLGLRLTLEQETGKLFPLSQRAGDVRDRLFHEARQRGVEIRSGQLVDHLIPGAPWRLAIRDQAGMEARAVILATGGLSAEQTGSDGVGLRIARELSHEIHDTYPALTPLSADPPVHAALAGVTVPVSLTATVAKRKLVVRGNFLFTHTGYSGPAVLEISHVATRAGTNGVAQEILVQWSALSQADWESRLSSTSSRLVLTVLREVLPARLAEVLLAEARIAADRRLPELRREERRALVDRLVRYPLPWTHHEGYKKAEVTGGGVALSEVSPRTLESRRHPGLFLCGEVLDAAGPIGGHNFAWAWATGRAAGLGAAAFVSQQGAARRELARFGL